MPRHNPSLAATVATASRNQNLARQRLNFNADWRFYLGETADAKPLGAGYVLQKWRVKSGNDRADLSSDTAGAGWKDAGPNDDVFGKAAGFAWFRATLAPAKTPGVLKFAGVDDNATVYLNGQQVATHEGWDSAFEVPLQGKVPGKPMRPTNWRCWSKTRRGRAPLGRRICRSVRPSNR